jgi:hypothetical protein
VQPLFECGVTPVVVNPEEAALQQVRPQSHDFGVGELRGPGVLHADVRHLQQFGVCEVHDDVLGFTGGILADAHLGQFGEALREISLGVWVIGGPALAAGFAAVAGIHHAAVVEAVAERIRSRRSAGAPGKTLRTRGRTGAYAMLAPQSIRRVTSARGARRARRLNRRDRCGRCNRRVLHRLHLLHRSAPFAPRVLPFALTSCQASVGSCRATGSTPAPSS